MIPLIPLVSVEAAIEHIKAPVDNDAELKKKLELASSIVMHHMKLEGIPEEWIVSDDSPVPDPDAAGGIPRAILETNNITIIETLDDPAIVIRVPGNVQAAVLLVLGELYENREASMSNPISDSVVALLVGFRDPTFS